METRKYVIDEINHLEGKLKKIEIGLQGIKEEMVIEQKLRSSELFIPKNLESDYMQELINERSNLENRKEQIEKELTLLYAKEISYQV